jgi:hypothetical protein
MAITNRFPRPPRPIHAVLPTSFFAQKCTISAIELAKGDSPEPTQHADFPNKQKQLHAIKITRISPSTLT